MIMTIKQTVQTLLKTLQSNLLIIIKVLRSTVQRLITTLQLLTITKRKRKPLRLICKNMVQDIQDGDKINGCKICKRTGDLYSR